MIWSHLITLAVIQGLTEFLPVSSSGHLLLVPALTGWEDQGLALDVAVHLGSLLAVMAYFWRDVGLLAKGSWRIARLRGGPEAKTVGYLVLTTVPLVLAGAWVASSGLAQAWRAPEVALLVVGWSTVGFGLALWLADRMGLTLKRLEHVGVPDALLLGLAQMLALIPGASRSGVTMTMARFLGFERLEAARYAMLMSIPAILAAAAYQTLELIQAGNVEVGLTAAIAAGMAFVAAYLSIWAMMAWLRRAGMTPFVVYRCILGGALLSLAYGLT